MENIIADSHVRTAMQASIDRILSEKGLSDLFYSIYVTDFYLLLDEADYLDFRLVIERSGEKIAVVYDFKRSRFDSYTEKQHRDLEMTFHYPSWEPLTLKHHRFPISYKSRTIRNISPSFSKYEPEINEFSSMWASIIRKHEWEDAVRFEWGYKIEGVWHRGRIRER